METLRVVVADDNAVVRSGLVSLLEAGGVEVVGEARDGERAVVLAERLRPHLVLLDVRMPLMDGVTAAREIARTTRVLMLTYTDTPETIRAAIGNGAAGYLVHGTFTPEELLEAVHEVARGANPLSPAAAAVLVGAVRDQATAPPQPSGARFGLSARETEVMELVARGCSNGTIAARLFLAEKTIKNHVNHIYAKLGVTTRAAAIALWLGSGTRQEDWQ
ncbi:response regulator transcription factor [Actinomadura sp. DC4]|uniref:response regulator n=1 Tax=Actinomadura sp. DC4 TaxID=3055069 RepID=UPI0025B0E91A|nr:response regulator transcription factor [Actinomadura sp. DC4]MDN3356891.1 response regulator transcription factor [Actinomadura sp. DC4]